MDLPNPLPLFPLSNLAIFPHSLLPLQIVEPCDRQMIADALTGERLIAVAQLSPGWEVQPPPLPVEPHICLGRIHACECDPDGRYALVLQGIARGRILSELETDRLYRIARIETISDRTSTASPAEQERSCRELLDAFRDLNPRSTLQPMLHDSGESAIPLGTLCDLVASALPLSPVEAQELLAEADVARRYTCLLNHLRRLRRSSSDAIRRSTFPPGFSAN